MRFSTVNIDFLIQERLKLFMDSVVEHEVIATKCPPKEKLDDIFDRLIGEFNFVRKEK